MDGRGMMKLDYRIFAYFMFIVLCWSQLAVTFGSNFIPNLSSVEIEVGTEVEIGHGGCINP